MAQSKLDLALQVTGAFDQSALKVKSATTYALSLKPNESLTADRLLNFIVNDTNRTIDLSGNLTVSSAATISGTNTGDQTSVSGNAGTATALQTARGIYGNNFDGTAALTQVIASTYGGTGNGFTKFSGATTAEKTYTLPNASCNILTDNAAITVAQGGTGLATLTTPYGVVCAGTTATGALQNAGTGTSGQVLTSNGTNALPSFQAVPGALTQTMRAHRGTSDQSSITSGVATKIQFNTVDWDVGSYYDNTTNYRFLPTVAGKYRITTGLAITSSSNFDAVTLSIYKNGSLYSNLDNVNILFIANNIAHIHWSDTVSLNGSTDYIEIFASTSSGGTILFKNNNSTFFSVDQIR